MEFNGNNIDVWVNQSVSQFKEFWVDSICIPLYECKFIP